jgi:hypothetical protein
MISSRGGHPQLFVESPIAIPQLEGSTSAIAIPQLFKEMLLRNRNSAIPQPQLRNSATATPQFRNRNSAILQSQFFLKPATSSPQLESFTTAIFGIFLALE